MQDKKLASKLLYETAESCKNTLTLKICNWYEYDYCS